MESDKVAFRLSHINGKIKGYICGKVLYIGNALPLSMQKRKCESLTLDEEEKLLAVLETHEDELLFRLELTTGIRREDIAYIELAGVDLKAGTIKFYQNKKRNWHTVPIAAKVKPILERYINGLPKGRKRLFDLTGRTAYNRLQYYLKKAGITRHLAFHDLRRTFAKNSQKRGLPAKAVAQIMDDKEETVSDWYNNLDMEELKQEAAKL